MDTPAVADYSDAVACRAPRATSAPRDTGRTVAYVRVSPSQDTATGRRKAAPAGDISELHTDVAAGAASLRPALLAAIAALRAGDVFTVRSLAQLSWREDELRDILAVVEQAGAHFVAQDEGMDTRERVTAFEHASVMRRFAENVRAERAASTIHVAQDRRSKIDEAAWEQAKIELAAKAVSITELAARLGVRRSTIYRRLTA